MKKSPLSTRYWTRLLTLPLAGAGEPPVAIDAREGKGLHLLMRARAGRLLVVSFMADDGRRNVCFRSAGTAMSYLGELDPGECANDWLEVLKKSVEKVSQHQGWLEFLRRVMALPAASLPGGSIGESISGDPGLVRICTRCNASCDFCSARGVLPDLVEDREAIQRRVANALKAGRSMISFTGGEPTLRKDLPEILAMAGRLGAREIDLQTNGILLARSKIFEPLCDAGLSSIFLSLHSADRRVHDSMLGVAGAFDKALAAAELCLENGVLVRLNCVLTASNLEGLADLVQLAADRLGRGTHLCLSFVALQGWALDHPELVPRLSQAAPQMARALDLGDSLDLDLRIPGLCGIPICMLPGYEEHFDEFHAADPPRQPDRSFAPACADCPYRQRCSGFWNAYFDLYGNEEPGYRGR
ncbi:MAG TPA: radical SAM protein [Myxococcota bacterium]|nr:radical SAM protein [Myxococcota bacterium]